MINRIALSIALATCLAASGREAPIVAACGDGALEISEPDVRFMLRLVYPKWNGQSVGRQTDKCPVPEKGAWRRFGFAEHGSATNHPARNASGRMTVADEASGGVRASYEITLPDAASLQQVGLQGGLPATVFADGTFSADGRDVPMPAVSQGGGLFVGKARRASFRNASGTTLLSFDFGAPTSLELMRRKSAASPNYTFRITFAGTGDYPGATCFRKSFTVRGARPFRADDGSAWSVAAGTDWIPLEVDRDIVEGSACDMSSIAGDHSPCGTCGSVVVRNGHFEFANRPGRRVRFYGANVCMSACYPTREQADWLCRTLVKCGYNAVRFHHFDTLLTTDGTNVDPAKAARLDNLVAACAKHGLYITTDLFVGRRTPWNAIGEDAKGYISQRDFKECVFFSKPLQDNFKDFTRQLLGRTNTVSGVRYADDPAFACIAFVNENNAGNYNSQTLMSRSGAKEAWRAWLATRKKENPAYRDVSEEVTCNVWDQTRDAAAFRRFLAFTEERFATEMKRFLREELACGIPVSDMSSWFNPPTHQFPREHVYDYVDDHFYFDHPRFPVRKWSLPYAYRQDNPVRTQGGDGMPRVVLRRIFGKPFTVSEFNYVAPNRYRACAGILTGAAAALQDWDGLWRFEWAMDEKFAFTIGTPPFTGKGFNVCGDPVQLATERAFAALYLRGDLAPLEKTGAVVVSRKFFDEPSAGEPCQSDCADAIKWAWRVRLGTVADREAPQGTDFTWGEEGFTNLSERLLSAQLPPTPVAVDPASGSFTVSSPRTCGVFAEEGRLAAGALSADISGHPAAVWASSLDDAPIAKSRRILLTHLTDVLSEGTTFAGLARRLLLKYGDGRFVMARGRADVSLAVARPAPGERWKIYALSTGGRRLREVRHECSSDGRLGIACDVAADPANATFLYELVLVKEFENRK